jgi:phosphohistidine phosphatase SixA
MRKLYAIIVCLLLTLSLSIVATAQKTKTIILIRHAEKEAAAMTDSANPPLSAAGKERAERLAKVVRKYHPGAIYSTDTIRTRSTVEPLAKKRGLTVQIYDASKPQDLVNTIMTSKTKRFVIVGHSNTIPPLANLLAKKELFKNLEDNEYSVIWLIRLRQGKPAKVELLDY